MEPITGAAAFASVVGLLRIFKQERGEKARLNHTQMLEWLEYHRHDELRKLIIENPTISAELDKVLAGDEQILRKLDQIQETMLSLAAQMEGITGLAKAFGEPTLAINQDIKTWLYRKAIESEDTTVEWDQELMKMPDWEDSLLELERQGYVQIGHALGTRIGQFGNVTGKLVLEGYHQEAGRSPKRMMEQALDTFKEKRQWGATELAEKMKIPKLVANSVLQGLAERNFIKLLQASGHETAGVKL